MKSPTPEAPKRPYHHGDLRNALLEAAERILEDQGLPGLTLRATAREVGVSHTAPLKHFEDLTALTSDLAAVGFSRFSLALTEAASAAGEDQLSRNRATARAYIGFARRYPQLFALMFRGERLDGNRPALHEAIEAARQALRQTAGSDERAIPPLQQIAAGAARWSLVHGFAMLLIEHRLDGMMEMLPDCTPETLFDAVLDCVRIGPAG